MDHKTIDELYEQKAEIERQIKRAEEQLRAQTTVEDPRWTQRVDAVEIDMDIAA